MIRLFIQCCCALSLALMVIGCPAPIGQCRYGSAGGESWTGVITQVEVVGDVYVVRIQGDSQQEFRLTESEYQACIATHSLEVGSEVGVVIVYGGPCPPQKRLTTCP